MRRLYIHVDKEAERSFASCVATLEVSLHQTERSAFQDFSLLLLDDVSYKEKQEQAKQASKLLTKHGEQAFLESEYSKYFSSHDLMLSFTAAGAGIKLCLQPKMSPLVLDFENTAYRQRLLRGGRQKEAVARAVMQGIEDNELIFDATAGLGRESMILAHAGARVLSFERQLPVWILLHDAFARAQGSRFFPFTLPTLHTLGTIKDYKGEERPQVIYYDPMFPERENSAQVKKEMFIFQQLIGHDTDTDEFLEYALGLAKKRVVVKRPTSAPPVETADIKVDFSVDGGQCRFDCYQCH